MSRETDSREADAREADAREVDAPETGPEREGRTVGVDPGSRQVLAVAALFALLGGTLVRLATVEPPAALWTAVAAALLAAAVVVFGADAVRTALGGGLRR